MFADGWWRNGALAVRRVVNWVSRPDWFSVSNTWKMAQTGQSIQNTALLSVQNQEDHVTEYLALRSGGQEPGHRLVMHSEEKAL